MLMLSGYYRYGIYTCKMISCVLNQSEYCVSQNINLDLLYQFQRFHNVANTTYIVLRDKYNEDQIKKFELDYKKNLVREVRFEIAGQQVFSAFEQARIPFIILKGAVLKHLYPKSGLRYFTDYDIYIGDRCSDIEKIMTALGYEFVNDTGNDMSFVHEPSLNFEMHYNLFSSKYVFNDYFNNLFEKSKSWDKLEFGYILKNDVCFIYVLTHLYKHFIEGGCGIKQFMDIYVMTKNMSLDMEYIKKELKKIGLEGFFETTIKLNSFLFDGAEADDNLKQIADYVFNNGTFGNVKNSMALEYVQDEESKNRRFGLYKAKYFANRWQLSFSGMKRQYPVLSKIPTLLPFCYCHKLFRVLLFRRDVFKTQVHDINDFSDDYSTYINHILDISGAKIDK